MKKITIIILIVLVLAILAGVILLTISRDELRYVCDYKTSTSSSLAVKRLYSSGIDEEKTEELAASLLTTSFTEDELLEAALKAGEPKFYPWFSFQVLGSVEKNTMTIVGNMGQDLFDGQEASNYAISNLTLEVVSDSAYINTDETVIYGVYGDGSAETVAPIEAEDGSSLAAKLDRSGVYEIIFTGTSGTVMIQYTYDVCTSGALINRTVLENQILQVYITVSVDEDGKLKADYEVIDASEVSELY